MTTPLNVLSGTPTAPLYIGFPHEVWVVRVDYYDDHDYAGPATVTLCVDEESARHFFQALVRERCADTSASQEDITAIVTQAGQDWVPGIGTVLEVVGKRGVTNDVTITAHPYAVHVATAAGCKTLALSRADALGALGR